MDIEESDMKTIFYREDNDSRYNHVEHKHPTIPHLLLPADPCMVNPNSKR
jgi:hypothetical protein